MLVALERMADREVKARARLVAGLRVEHVAPVEANRADRRAIALRQPFGEPARDPRGRVISVAYVALLNTKVAAQQIQAGSDARKTQWFDIGEPSMTALPKLALRPSGPWRSRPRSTSSGCGPPWRTSTSCS